MIIVEKAIPLPQSGSASSGAKGMYPYAKMEVGDSFLAPCKHNPISIAKRWGRPRGIDFTSRKDDGGWRIWRIK